jgi:hypothetical protein
MPFKFLVFSIIAIFIFKGMTIPCAIYALILKNVKETSKILETSYLVYLRLQI